MSGAETPFAHVVEATDLWSRTQVLTRPSPVPAAPGLYGWFFRAIPPGVDVDGCRVVDGLTLLYVGISPKAPPANGRAPSRSTRRQRLQTHYAGNAEGSTLRKTLGCLLAGQTAYPLRRVGSGRRLTFTNPGEQALDRWMSDNAFVAWITTDQPWIEEHRILQSGTALPLNIRDNPCERHTLVVRRARQEAVSAALAHPVVVDGGGPRRT